MLMTEISLFVIYIFAGNAIKLNEIFLAITSSKLKNEKERVR